MLGSAVAALFLLALARPAAVAPVTTVQAAGEPPNVVVIVWNDATLERLGFLKEHDHEGVTPRLDALFADGAVFPQGSSVCPRGRPTTAMVLSGRTPQESQIFCQTAPPRLAPAETLGALAHAQGYATLYVGKFREGKAADFGFEREVRGVIEAGAGEVTSFVAEAAGKHPLLLWFAPEVPEGFGAKNLDGALGELLDALEAHGAKANTLFVFLTNGEAKGLEFSAEESTAVHMRTVLALAGAARLASGRVPAGTHAELVTPLDVFPSVLELAGLGGPQGLPGRSLRGLLAGEPWAPRPLAASFYTHSTSGARAAQALERNLLALVYRDQNWKYALFLEDVGVKVDKHTELVEIERSAGDQLLFDLDADPREEHNLSAESAHFERLNAMRAALLAGWQASGGPEFKLPYLPPPLGPAPKEPHPNVVLVVADDMDYEHLGFLGNARVKTPTLDELAKTGVVFPVAHVPMSRCRPSLAALLSGRWPQQTGVFENESTHTLTRRDSLPNLLKAAGYATFQGGKFWEGSQFSMGFLAPEKADTVFQRFVREDQDELFAFIDRYHTERPLFLWWAPMLPHGPFNPPERFVQEFKGTEIPVPSFIEGEAKAYQDAERTAFAMEAWFDDGLAQLRAKLEATGELADTLFVFLIDNGYANGFPSKGTVFEKGLRTPIVVSWPKGIAGGRTLSDLVSSVDLYRTILDYAGVPAPESASGLSLRPTIEGKAAPREAIFGAVYGYRERAGQQRPENCVYALYARTPGWKYVYYLRTVEPDNYLFYHDFAPFPAHERGDRALFDIEHDPYEQHDLSDDPTNAGVMERLQQGVLEWWRATGGGELDLSADSSDTPLKKKPKNNRKKQ
jgi:uncharacterized sulfatase